MPRWIIVDDSNQDIQYIGSWFQDYGSQDNLGNFGQPYLHTLHGTSGNGSFSYSFRGSRVLITGTVEFPDLPNVSPDVSWECIVDGVSTQSITYTDANNRLRLCEVDELENNMIHNITVNTQVSSQKIFWMDYIQYLPFDDVPLDNATLFIETPDPEMLLGPGWLSYYPGLTTSTQETTFRLGFTGISLLWMGFYDKNQHAMDITTASYSVDGNDFITFQLNGALANSTGVQYNQLFFDTGTLSPGDHRLDVIYHGDSTKTPLNLYVLIVQNGTTSGTATATIPDSTPSPSNPSQATRPRLIGIVVSTVIGGILFIAVAMWLLWRIRRHQSRIPISSAGTRLVEPFPPATGLSRVAVPDSSVSTSILRQPDPVRLRSPYLSSPQRYPPPTPVTPTTTNYSARTKETFSSATSTAPSSRLEAMIDMGNSASRDEGSGIQMRRTAASLPETLPPHYTPT